MICDINIKDIRDSKLSDDYQRAVAAVLPPNMSPLEAFWRELAAVVAGYLISQQNPAGRRSPVHEIERWQKIAELAATEGKQNTALTAAKNLAEAQIAAHQVIKDNFNRKKNMYNEALYIGILDLWHRGLGQKLSSSLAGPLSRFFSACVKRRDKHGLSPCVEKDRLEAVFLVALGDRRCPL
jgi:hypothetical protein